MLPSRRRIGRIRRDPGERFIAGIAVAQRPERQAGMIVGPTRSGVCGDCALGSSPPGVEPKPNDGLGASTSTAEDRRAPSHADGNT